MLDFWIFCNCFYVPLRSRSRSPGESRARLPPEVLQHLKFGLVEPNDDSLRGEIPFTNVETSSNPQRPHVSRARQLKTATTRSVVSAMELAESTSTILSNSERLNRAETASAIAASSNGHNHASSGHMPRNRHM